ncbi:MAG TPA: hypothetical protein VL172_18975 [Kofleriaceae bacterium]|nr:hypothetical protein [Kofleriaceae bacterium]
MAKDRYYDALDYLEIHVPLHDPPKPATLRRRRREAPDPVGFGMLVSGFHLGVAAPDALATIAAEAGNTRAEVVVFQSIAAVTPSQANRDGLRRFFDEVAPADRMGGARRAWLPHGLWDPQTAAKLAAEIGLLYVCDPLARDQLGPPPEFYAGLGEQAYFRLTGLGGGGQTQFAAHELEFLAALAASYQHCWTVFANPGRFRDAVALRQLIAGGES